MGSCFGRCFGLCWERSSDLTTPLQSPHSVSGVKNRAFAVIRHEKHGYLLVEGTAGTMRKHFQVVGVDVDPETASSEQITESGITGEDMVCRTALAHYILESLGLNFRDSIERLVPVDMEGYGKVGREIRQTGRHFYRLDIRDEDSVQDIPKQFLVDDSKVVQDLGTQGDD